MRFWSVYQREDAAARGSDTDQAIHQVPSLEPRIMQHPRDAGQSLERLDSIAERSDLLVLRQPVVGIGDPAGR